MPRLDTVLVVLLAMPAAAFANPDTVRPYQEKRIDLRQLAVDQDWNERDARELAEFEQLAAALKDAGKDRMMGRYREVNARVRAAMTREIEQVQVKSAQAAQEARVSGREPASRMDASFSSDAPDLLASRDEVRDRDNTQARYEEMARIATMSTALQNPIERGDRRAIKRNLELTQKFLDLMRREFAASRAEMSEDRAELREDER